MIPNKPVGDKEIVGIQINVVHHRGEQSLHTDNLGRIYAERIAGKHFFEEKRDYVSGIERGLERSGTVKARTGDIYMGGQTEMGFGVSIHSFVTSLFST
jgi:hypothetical protein